MAVNLNDFKLEIRVLKSLTSENETVKALAFGRVRDESFDSGATQETFKLIKTYAKLGEIPTWENLITDRRLSEDTYNQIYAQKVTEARNRAEVEIILRQLDEYRQRRAVFEMAEKAYLGIQANEDVEVLLNNANEELSNARITHTSDSDMFSIGGQEGSRTFSKIFKDIKKGNAIQKIPTGIETFDKVNGGVPEGSAFVIGAPSGEGKSALALNLAINMANSGVPVCYVSMEMDSAQTFTRYMSILTAIPVVEIENAKYLSGEKLQRIDRAIAIHNASLRMNGGRFVIKTPFQDLSVEELLYGLKPFGFKVIVMDYLTLFRGLSGERAWELIGEAVRLSKRIADLNKCACVPVVQTDKDGDPRFSQMIKDNASLMWTWGAVKDPKKNKPDSVESFDVFMNKTRNQVPVPLKLFRKFSIMQITDNPHDIGRPWIEQVPNYEELEKLSIRELDRIGTQKPGYWVDFIQLNYIQIKQAISRTDFKTRTCSQNRQVYRGLIPHKINTKRTKKDAMTYKNNNVVKGGGFSAKRSAVMLRGGIASSRR